MNDRLRNRCIWAVCIAMALALWGLVARTRMHFVDELLFLGCIALVAAVLTALYWWDVARSDPDDSDTDPNRPREET